MFLFLRSVDCLEVQRHLGYSVQSLDKGGNACPQRESRIGTEKAQLLGLFHPSVIFSHPYLFRVQQKF